MIPCVTNVKKHTEIFFPRFYDNVRKNDIRCYSFLKSNMSAINYLDRMQYQRQIKELQEEVQQLQEELTLERQEQRSLFRLSENDMNTSNYVNPEYYMESQYIHTLKKQINILIEQNNSLKIKNRELMEALDKTF